MRFVKECNMKSWLSHWVPSLAEAPSVPCKQALRIAISSNQILKLKGIIFKNWCKLWNDNILRNDPEDSCEDIESILSKS